MAARDLFDICCAAKTGRRGFDQALNALTEAEQRQIKSLWESAEMEIADEARTKLSGINDEDLVPPETLVAEAVTTLKDQRYASTIIRAGRGRATARTLTVNGRPNDYESTAATLERDFEARGFSGHLMRHNIRPRTVLEGGARTHRRAGDGRDPAHRSRGRGADTVATQDDERRRRPDAAGAAGAADGDKEGRKGPDAGRLLRGEVGQWNEAAQPRACGDAPSPTRRLSRDGSSPPLSTD